MGPYFRRIEHLALQLRHQLALASDARLEPLLVLERMEVDVYQSAYYIPGLGVEAAMHLCDPDSGFSGIAAEICGRRLVLLNPSHTAERRRVTMMEEAAHFLFGHVPTHINVLDGLLPTREYHKEQEREAYAFAAATLLPESQVQALVHGQRSLAETTMHFGVSQPLVEYCAKTTGWWAWYCRLRAA